VLFGDVNTVVERALATVAAEVTVMEYVPGRAPVPVTAETPSGVEVTEAAATPLESDVAAEASDLILERRSPMDEIWTLSAACFVLFLVMGCDSSATSLSTMLFVSRPEARPPALKTELVVVMENPLWVERPAGRVSPPGALPYWVCFRWISRAA